MNALLKYREQEFKLQWHPILVTLYIVKRIPSGKTWTREIKTPTKKISQGEIPVLPSSHKPKEIKRLAKSHPKAGDGDGAETYFLKSNPEF